jgi:Replication-relaxation
MRRGPDECNPVSLLQSQETADFIGEEETAQNRIIPDAAFIIENRQTGRRALFFVEMDMATERIINRISFDKRSSLHHKIAQYDQYLSGGRFAKTYAAYGEFRFFTLLFITLSWQRVEHIRQEMQDLPATLADYYRFTTFDTALGDFFGKIWKSRLVSDTTVYPLVREGSTGTS